MKYFSKEHEVKNILKTFLDSLYKVSNHIAIQLFTPDKARNNIGA
jgi:hypothetical protein